MSIEENKAIAHRYFKDLWSRGNLALADEIIATDYVDHDPASLNFGTGPEVVKQIVTLYRTTFPNIQFVVEDMVAEGNKVVARWTARGTNIGLMGIPTSKQTTVAGIYIFRIVSGKIEEVWTSWDILGLMQQLGASQWLCREVEVKR